MARFKVQARVLDLLGLQQIANPPTAISELFKNAWDAYADQAKLDIFLVENRAVLWDDGIGMTEEDILDRWLLIGAAGKEKLRASLKPPSGKEPRPVQGEKGIGRLAIATLGDTLLLVSRSIRPTKPSEPFSALLINWNIVRNEKLLLSDLEIPTITFKSLDDLSTGIINVMAEDIRNALLSEEQAYAWKEPAEKRRRDLILEQLSTFSFDAKYIRQTSLAASKSGTLFYVGHLRDDFKADFLPDSSESSKDELVQLLSNFKNPFENENQTEKFISDIRLWDDSARKLVSTIENSNTISEEDLRLYDHYIDINFDQYGRFEGVVEIYGKPVDLKPLEDQVKRNLHIGPFHLRLWYYQGEPKSSRLDAEHFSLMEEKLGRFGGLMIYRDDLRVLPYGRPEFDWLLFEERRSRSASRYFFSYRRMFGYVSITRAKNPHLVDKAGREGLISNFASRQFRELLESFFSDLALKYLQKGSDFYLEKEAMRERSKRIGQEEKLAKERRKYFRNEVRRKLTYMEKAGPEDVRKLISTSLRYAQDSDIKAMEPSGHFSRFEAEIAKIEANARLEIPKTLSLGTDSDLKRLIYDHGVAFPLFQDLCRQARQEFYEKAKEIFRRRAQTLDLHKIVEAAHKNALDQVNAIARDLRAVHEKQTNATTQSIDRLVEAQRMHVETVYHSALSEIPSLPDDSALDLSSAITRIRQAAEEAILVLSSYREEISSDLEVQPKRGREELIALQLDEIEELREEVTRNLGLVQLGLAVEVIDHDLNKSYRGIHASLARLRTLVRNAPKAAAEVDSLRANFQHLEQRYKLMSPLYRGSYRIKNLISGRDLLAYCRDFLSHPINSLKASISATPLFCQYQIEEVPAVVYPVFVNLVDNALFWIRNSEDKRVLFDRKGEVLTICDTGPGIHETVLDEIFKPFVSTKSGGRGLGLYIARANLERYGHSVWATNDPEYRTLPGACICIRFHEDVVRSE